MLKQSEHYNFEYNILYGQMETKTSKKEKSKTLYRIDHQNTIRSTIRSKCILIVFIDSHYRFFLIRIFIERCSVCENEYLAPRSIETKSVIPQSLSISVLSHSLAHAQRSVSFQSSKPKFTLPLQTLHIYLRSFGG